MCKFWYNQQSKSKQAQTKWILVSRWSHGRRKVCGEWTTTGGRRPPLPPPYRTETRAGRWWKAKTGTGTGTDSCRLDSNLSAISGAPWRSSKGISPGEQWECNNAGVQSGLRRLPATQATCCRHSNWASGGTSSYKYDFNTYPSKFIFIFLEQNCY